VKKFSLIIGNFDGVHLGHQSLIREGLDLSPVVRVLSFRPHPIKFLKPNQAPTLLYDYRQQEEVLLRSGVDRLQSLQFDSELAHMTGTEFFHKKILSLNPWAVVVGDNFRFGAGRASGIEEMLKFCQESNLYFKAVSPLLADGEPVSSSRIRDHLGKGNLSMASALLGRNYGFQGIVVHGKHLARQLGYPTANIELAPEREGRLPLKIGVYAGMSAGMGPFVMNIGVNPTVQESDSSTLKVEAHFFNNSDPANLDLYGKHLSFEILHYLREEKKFNGLSELKNQIGLDIQSARKVLGL
jgi:riboflavin kinase/FMN adenylyltransferase